MNRHCEESRLIGTTKQSAMPRSYRGATKDEKCRRIRLDKRGVPRGEAPPPGSQGCPLVSPFPLPGQEGGHRGMVETGFRRDPGRLVLDWPHRYSHGNLEGVCPTTRLPRPSFVGPRKDTKTPAANYSSTVPRNYHWYWPLRSARVRPVSTGFPELTMRQKPHTSAH